jgi:hypothetical protein
LPDARCDDLAVIIQNFSGVAAPDEDGARFRQSLDLSFTIENNSYVACPADIRRSRRSITCSDSIASVSIGTQKEIRTPKNN